jgi:hypothetical protein
VPRRIAGEGILLREDGEIIQRGAEAVLAKGEVNTRTFGRDLEVLVLTHFGFLL